MISKVEQKLAIKIYKEDWKLATKWFFLMVLALVLLVVISPILFISQVSFRLFHLDYHLWYYFRAIAIGIDSLGGSIIYGSRLHTISGMSGYFECVTTHKSRLFKWISIWHSKIQSPFIDLFFGKDHCYKEAVDEELLNACKSKDR